MKYNTETQQLIEDNNDLGPVFYREPWRDAATGEKDSYFLEKEKKEYCELRQSYLNSTDWYILRKVETMDEIPTDVSTERNKIRNEMSIIRLSKTMQELNDLNLDK